MAAQVTQVARSRGHHFSKKAEAFIRLTAGLGVDGDCHAGVTVKHRSRVAKDANQPNLRQVHLIHSELFEEVRAQGFAVASSELGENITTRGVDLLALPRGTRLRIGIDAIVEITGLRNPCVQIERFQAGLMKALSPKDANGNLVRKSGVMGIVIEGGDVQPGDAIAVELPALPHEALLPV